MGTVSTGRVIQVSITDRYSRGKCIVPGNIPEKRADLAAFIEGVFPQTHIEHLGRTQAVELSRYGRGHSPYSLFFQAVHSSFDQHYPLALSPEVLMYLIAHEVAVTVNKHPETYRHLFTQSADKQTILVRDDTLVRGNPNSNWARTLDQFDIALTERVPPGIMDHLLPSFSTHTVESRAASLVTFMDAAKSFYDYRTQTMCGIPLVRLDGTPQDYQTLLNCCSQLAEVFETHLGEYFRHLLPVLATIARTAAGAPVDNEFWKSLYKYNSLSGGDKCSGWITAFLAYTRDYKNGQMEPKRARLFDWASLSEHEGLSSGAFPTHVSTAPFIWEYYGTEYPMLFAGGVLGIENSAGFIKPQLSYAVLNTAQ
jgi:Domain of unknown function (DUF4419)